MRRKWVTSAETCERACVLAATRSVSRAATAGVGQARCRRTHADWRRGSLGMIYVLITATALDTALCFTGAPPKALAPAWGLCFTSAYSQRKASVLSGGCREVRSWGCCCCTFISYIHGSYITGFCHSFVPAIWHHGCTELHVLCISPGQPSPCWCWGWISPWLWWGK